MNYMWYFFIYLCFWIKLLHYCIPVKFKLHLHITRRCNRQKLSFSISQFSKGNSKFDRTGKINRMKKKLFFSIVLFIGFVSQIMTTMKMYHKYRRLKFIQSIMKLIYTLLFSNIQFHKDLNLFTRICIGDGEMVSWWDNVFFVPI